MKAFTLMEMMIVLIIMGIITMMTMGITGDQLHKLQQKTVKESLLAEYQTHYTKNLTSSRYAGQVYTGMTITFSSGANQISFNYYNGVPTPYHTETFSDSFEIQKIYTNPDGQQDNLYPVSTLNLHFTPYQGNCKILNNDGQEIQKNIAFVLKIKEMKDYCFSISPQMCRMVEVPCEANWMYEE